jgi:hypothetical protein
VRVPPDRTMVKPRFDADAGTPEARRAFHEQNRLSWDEATRARNSHKADQARFHREGGNCLYREEIELLGDLRGQSVVHLQCNSGQDTLSLKRLGAAKDGRRWTVPDEMPDIPFMYSIAARKPT